MAKEESYPEGTAAARYAHLATQRAPFLRRGRDASRLSIPSLLPPEGTGGASTLYEPFQSAGADGVNNLSAKLLLVLFPPGSSFYRLSMDDDVVQQLKKTAGGGQQGEDARADFEAALGAIERKTMNHLEEVGARAVHVEALKHLIVVGNVLLFVDNDARAKFFPLDRYVVCRDLSGNVLEIVVQELMSRAALPDKVREFLSTLPEDKQKDGSKDSNEKTLELYTWVRRVGNKWEVHQEVCGAKVPKTEGTYPLDKSAWLPLRWTKVAGEAYGRGRCEEYIGDLKSLESLERSIVEIAHAAAKILLFVNESGTTSKDAVAEADSGDVLDGQASDVTVLALEKMQDFRVASEKAEKLERRLERAFLITAGIQRNAERVTAEEIRLMAGELEQSLGGVYSILAEEYQRPFAVRVLHRLQMLKKVPQLPKGAVSPQIVTGIAGLGRSSDLQRLDELVDKAGQQFGPDALAAYINVGALLKRRGAALGIDLTDLVRTEGEVQQSRQQAQQAELAQKVAPNVVKGLSDQRLAAQAAGPTK